MRQGAPLALKPPSKRPKGTLAEIYGWPWAFMDAAECRSPAKASRLYPSNLSLRNLQRE